jgi:hypothetical protein
MVNIICGYNTSTPPTCPKYSTIAKKMFEKPRKSIKNMNGNIQMK